MPYYCKLPGDQVLPRPRLIFTFSFQIVMHDVEFWQLGDVSEMSVEGIDNWLNAKAGWITGRYEDTTYCVGETMSERPPWGTKYSDKGDAWKDLCYPHSRK